MNTHDQKPKVQSLTLDLISNFSSTWSPSTGPGRHLKTPTSTWQECESVCMCLSPWIHSVPGVLKTINPSGTVVNDRHCWAGLLLRRRSKYIFKPNVEFKKYPLLVKVRCFHPFSKHLTTGTHTHTNTLTDREFHSQLCSAVRRIEGSLCLPMARSVYWTSPNPASVPAARFTAAAGWHGFIFFSLSASVSPSATQRPVQYVSVDICGTVPCMEVQVWFT